MSVLESRSKHTQLVPLKDDVIKPQKKKKQVFSNHEGEASQ